MKNKKRIIIIVSIFIVLICGGIYFISNYKNNKEIEEILPEEEISEEQRRISGIQRCELSLYGKFYEQQSVFPGTDVSGDPGLWRMADRTRKNGSSRSCHVCSVHRNLHQPNPDSG